MEPRARRWAVGSGGVMSCPLWRGLGTPLSIRPSPRSAELAAATDASGGCGPPTADASDGCERRRRATDASGERRMRATDASDRCERRMRAATARYGAVQRRAASGERRALLRRAVEAERVVDLHAAAVAGGRELDGLDHAGDAA